MSDWKKYKSVAAAKRAKSLYFKGSDGKKKVAVYKEELDKWKKKNKGAYKGSALAAWTKTKGKDIKTPKPKVQVTVATLKSPKSDKSPDYKSDLYASPAARLRRKLEPNYKKTKKSLSKISKKDDLPKVDTSKTSKPKVQVTVATLKSPKSDKSPGYKSK